MTEEEKLIELNNQLREQLTPENKAYYENILMYLRTKSLFHDELDVEKVLIELLQDILEAQKHNESAEAYFGQNPQAVLDTLLQQLPKISLRKKINLSLIIFTISSGFSLFSSLTKPIPSINLLTLFFNGLISIVFVNLVLYLINRYTFKPNKSKLKEYAAFLLLSFIFIGLTFLSNQFGDFWLSFHVHPMTSLLLVWLALLGVSLWIFIKKKKEYYYAIPSMSLLALLPTLQKIPATAALFYSNTNKIILVIIILVVFYGFSYLGYKKNQ